MNRSSRNSSETVMLAVLMETTAESADCLRLVSSERDEPPLPSERDLGDRYTLIAGLGWGKTSWVVEARDQVTGDRVALKVIHAEYRRDRGVRASILREFPQMSQLSHPGIVRAHRLERSAPAEPILVLEYVDGQSLSDQVECDGALEPDTVETLARQLSEVLDAVHESGLIHRDISAKNVLIERGGTLKLCDFGISVSTHHACRARNLLLGTPAFVAPELFQGCPASVQSDLYGFGAVVWFAATGRTPVEADSLGQLRDRVLVETPKRLDAIADVPSRLANVVARCLEKDPARRFHDAAALCRALDG